MSLRSASDIVFSSRSYTSIRLDPRPPQVQHSNHAGSPGKPPQNPQGPGAKCLVPIFLCEVNDHHDLLNSGSISSSIMRMMCSWWADLRITRPGLSSVHPLLKRTRVIVSTLVSKQIETLVKAQAQNGFGNKEKTRPFWDLMLLSFVLVQDTEFW